MVNEKILEFYEEFRDEVLGYVKENGPISTNTAFKALFLSYLTEAGELLFRTVRWWTSKRMGRI